MATTTQKIVSSITDIAKKTVVQGRQLIEVTVLSRNPDGTLNVTDGVGGCQRLAPQGNVRVGEKIMLGTEPVFGEKTNQEVVVVTLTDNPKPCPTDKRGAGLGGGGIGGGAGGQILRKRIGGPGYPGPRPPTIAIEVHCGLNDRGNGGLWENRLVLPTFPFGGFGMPDYAMSGTSGAIGEANDVVNSGHLSQRICTRGFVFYNTVGGVPPGRTLTSAALLMGGSGRSDHDKFFYVLPSSKTALLGGSSYSDSEELWTSLDFVHVLFGKKIRQTPYENVRYRLGDFFVKGDPANFLNPVFNPSGYTVLGFVGEYDLDGTSPPFVDSIPDASTQDSETFTFIEPSISPALPPILELSFDEIY
jgi:hypothetical protein